CRNPLCFAAIRVSMNWLITRQSVPEVWPLLPNRGFVGAGDFDTGAGGAACRFGVGVHLRTFKRSSSFALASMRIASSLFRAPLRTNLQSQKQKKQPQRNAKIDEEQHQVDMQG